MPPNQTPLGFCNKCRQAKVAVTEGGATTVVCPNCSSAHNTVTGPVSTEADPGLTDAVIIINSLGYKEALPKGSPLPAGARLATEADGVDAVPAVRVIPTAPAPLPVDSSVGAAPHVRTDRDAPKTRRTRKPRTVRPAPETAPPDDGTHAEPGPVRTTATITLELTPHLLEQFIAVLEAQPVTNVNEARTFVELADTLKEAYDSI